MAKTKAVGSRDVHSPCMSSQDGQLEMLLVDRLKICKEYFEQLLNEKNLWDNTLEFQKNVECVEQITFEEVRKAMSRLKKGKPTWPSGVSIKTIHLGNI